MSTDTQADVKVESSPAEGQQEITEGLKPDAAKEAEPKVSEDATGDKPVREGTAGEDKKTPKRDARINQLWKENKVKEERIKKLEEENGKLKVQATAVATPKPKRDTFETEEQYLDAYDKYLDSRIDQKVQERQQSVESKQVEAQQVQAWQEFDRIAATLDPEQYSDFDDVIAASANMEMSGLQREFIRTSKVGPQIFYHLAKNPELMDRIAKMPVEAQTDALVEIRKQVVKASDTKKVSSAPPPISPIGGDRATVEKDPDKMTDEEFNAWRRKGKLKYQVR